MSEFIFMRQCIITYLFVFLFVNTMFNPSKSETDSASGVFTGKLVFRLDPVDGRPLFSRDISFEGTDVRFRKEPVYEGTDIVRSALRTGRNKDEYLCFAWDSRNGVLYLDHNRNLDLTDDDGGIRRSPHKGKSYQLFRNIYIQSMVSGYPINYNITLGLDRHKRKTGYCQICSGWQGELRLREGIWHITVIDNMDGVIDGDDVIRIDDAAAPFNTKYRHLAPDIIPVPNRLSLGDREYKVFYAFDTRNGKTYLILTLEVIDTPSGFLVLKGYGIKRLVFSGQSGEERFVSLYDKPGSVMSVPARTYRQQKIVLNESDKFGLLTTSRETELHISDNDTTTVDLGCPLKNIAVVTRNGSYLMFNYRLVGAGGELYPQHVNPTSVSPPKFTIFCGDRKIGTGIFRPG